MTYPVDINSHFVISAGENDAIDLEGPPDQIPELYTLSNIPSGHPSFTLSGSLQITNSQNGVVIVIQDIAGSNVTISAGASLSVSSSTGSAIVYWIRDRTPTTTATIHNDGAVTVYGQAGAQGFALFKGESFVNTGTIQATASASTGLSFGVDGSAGDSTITNAGSILVSSPGLGAGVRLWANSNASASLINSGSITAIGAVSAVEIVGVSSSVLSVVNSGTLAGAEAINGNSGTGQILHLNNSGRISGEIDLGPGLGYSAPGSMAGSQIWNTGHIDGLIRLESYGNDLYDGRGGTHTGELDLGYGTDTVFLGDDGETVHSYRALGALPKAIVTSGAGNDTMIGDDGIDIFDGGAGDDHLDGGSYMAGGGGPLPVGYYGKNTVSYASATGGVTVSLGLQGGAQNTVSAGVDTLNNFQNLTGSAFADHLTGDSQDNAIAGRAGADVLTGAAGADTFVFAPGGGTDEVTDFSRADGDRIDLSLFHNLQAVDQVLAHAHQSGSNTVIELGAETITLDNVLLSSLTAQDFVLASRPSDFGQIGADALLFRNAATGDWGFMSMNAGGGETWHAIGASSADYVSIGKGDFNGDGVLDTAFRQGSTGDWGFLTVNPSGGESWHAVGVSSVSYAAVAVGDILGDGTSEIVFRNAATGDWGFMQANGPGGQAWHSIGASSPDYAVIGSGDFNGDGVFDVAFRQKSTGDWGFLSINPGGGETWHAVGASSLAYQAIGSASFLGDGDTQIAFRNPITGDWGFMQVNGGGGETWHSIGASSTDYDPIGVGDFNGDSVQDVAFRQVSTGDWGFLSVNPGGGETWHHVGATSLAYASI